MRKSLFTLRDETLQIKRSWIAKSLVANSLAVLTDLQQKINRMWLSAYHNR